MQEERIEKLLALLSTPAPEPSEQAGRRLRSAVSAEMRRLRTERDMARFGLTPVYHFAQKWLKEHPLRLLAPAAAGITIVAHVFTGSTLVRLMQALAGGW